MSGITVVAKLARGVSARLAVDTSPEFLDPVFSDPYPVSKIARLTVDGLAPGTDYYCAVEAGGHLITEKAGRFTTLPDAGPASFTCAFAGDASTGSNHQVFDQIRAANPLFFIHLGDAHYEDIGLNDVAAFEAAYDAILAAPRQAELYRSVPTLYMWDDHDYGPDNSHAGSVGRDAACQAYRLRVPHPELVEGGATDAVYFTYQVGRVMFIVTDQRSMASPASAADNASKSVLGGAQKAWFKGLLSDPSNAGKLFVWICSRVWGGVQTNGADHWGGFTTERTELADHVKAHCPGRFCVLSADMHSLAIDDGSNHDFATGGGAPIPTFQAAPLDRGQGQTYGGGTYSQGGRHLNNGQFGTMEVTDTGTDEITVTWAGFDSTGSQLVQYAFDAELGFP